MRPAREGAGRPLGAAGNPQGANSSTDILADRDAGRKQLPNLGNCASCGSHIRLVGGATTCPTCSAWYRWYSSFRLASKFLREVPR